MLEVTHSVERVFENLREVRLYVFGTCSRVGRHHHDGVRIEVREVVDGQIHQREDAEDREGREYQGRRNRIINRFSVYAHDVILLL